MTNPFSPRLTALYLAAWSLVMLQGWGARVDGNPTSWLRDPIATAQRVVVRDLELAEANERAGLLQPVRQTLFGSYEEVLAASISIQRDASETAETLAELESQGLVFQSEQSEHLEIGHQNIVRSNTALSVLLAEAGELDAAFELAEQRLPEATRDALEAIYGTRPRDAPPASKLDLGVLDPLAEAGLSDWLLDRPAIRWLERGGDPDAASEISHQIERRGARWQRRSEVLSAANIALIAAGAVLLLAMASGSTPRGSPARSVVPWSLALGFAVMIRADFWNRLYFVILAHLSAQLAEPEWLAPFYTWGTLIASLPLLWLIHRYLVPSSTGAFFKAFGMSPTRTQLPGILAIAVAALAIDLLGTTALAWGSWSLGFDGHWAEGLDETLIFGSTRAAIESSIDYTLFTPVFEELLFRGLLFYTLRNRFGAWQAAALSAAFFSAIHFYSFPGFMMTFWSGFVWAIAFERARSLWPGIMAHSVYNLFYVLGLLLVYR